MRNEGIGSWPARRARKTPHATAVIYGDRRWTYAQLYGRATRLAHALRGLGVRTGDRVAYLGPNDPSFCETLFATGMIGGIFVPLNMRLAVPELAHCLTDSGSTVLIHAPEQAEAVAEIDRVPRLIPLAGNGDNGYQSLIDGGRPDPIDEPVTLDDPCMIMYTSGTTGRPKGAVLTHGNITWNGVNVLVDIDLAGDEVTLVVAPLFHTAGLNMTCLPTFLKGGAVVLMPSFDPAAVLAAIATHRVTYMFGVPAMYQAMAASAAWPEADLSSLRQLNCGGAPVPMPTIRTYQERGLVFSQGYGMTETAPGALYLTSHASTAKAGTAGVPHFFTDVRVVDHEGNEVDPGEKGEVVVSGPNVMRDYWRRQADTSAVLRDDWLHSGDVATVDDDGFVSIVDRIRDVIISGGENVYPAEVEAV
ncbi:MAG: acyl-CoA synthetase, partial [Sciscionella sp.]